MKSSILKLILLTTICNQSSFSESNNVCDYDTFRNIILDAQSDFGKIKQKAKALLQEVNKVSDEMKQKLDLFGTTKGHDHVKIRIASLSDKAHAKFGLDKDTSVAAGELSDYLVQIQRSILESANGILEIQERIVHRNDHEQLKAEKEHYLNLKSKQNKDATKKSKK